MNPGGVGSIPTGATYKNNINIIYNLIRLKQTKHGSKV